MPLRLIVLSCLLAVTEAQTRFYCNSSSINATRFSDVLLYTRSETQSYYTAGQICEFNVIGPINSTFFVTVLAFTVSTAVCTISSGGRIMFNGSSMPTNKYTIISATNSLQLLFDATRDSSRRLGVVVRVQVVNFNECPPGWWHHGGSCYGTSTSDDRLVFLDYMNAQKACNNMRSNLLTIPSNYTSSIRSFIASVLYNVRNYPYLAWIGITDRATHNYRYWLDGLHQSEVKELACRAEGNYGECSTKERCGSVNKYDWGAYIFYMQDCNAQQSFLCEMPLGGTDKFYSVPEVDSVAHHSPVAFNTWIWILIGCLLLGIGLLVGGLILRWRARRSLVQAQANQSNRQSVTSTTDVTTSHRSPPQVLQQPVALYPVQYPDETAAPVYSVEAELPPPPSYSEVMASNQPFEATLGTGASIHYDRKLH